MKNNDLKILEHPQLVDKKAWEEFVRNHPQGNIFQTPQMYEVYLETPKFEPILLVAVQGSEIQGLLVAVIQKVYKGLLGKLSARSIIMGGPVIKDYDADVARQLLEEYDEIAKKKAVFTECRNLWDTKDLKRTFQSVGYSFKEHLNILVDLNKTEDVLWQEVEKRKRNRIRKAHKVGTVFSVEDSEETLKNAYGVLTDVYRRVKRPLPDFRYFENLMKKLNGNARLLIFVARHKEEVIGCSISLLYNSTIYDYYAGAYCKAYEKCPNDLIPWEIFRWGKANGYTRFDFGGAGKPNVSYGVRNYKKKFGGSFVELGRYEKIHQPVTYYFAKKAFYIWQKLQR